ncbi:unnamed protein product [Mucor hiemalis]
MSLFLIIKLSSYIYLLTSILLPTQTIDLTAQFLSLVLTQPIDYSNILPHVVKCIVLLVRFVVLYTILGGNAIYSLLKKEQREINPISKKSKEVRTPTINKTPADDVSLHSFADSKLKLKTVEEKTEESTVIPIIKNDGYSTAKSNNTPNPPPTQVNPTNPTSNSEESDAIEEDDKDVTINKETQQLLEPLHEVNKEMNQLNLDEEIKSKSSPLPIKNNNSDGMTEGKPSAVKKILAQDQLIKDNSIPDTTDHVISADADRFEKDEKKAEVVVPSFTPDNLDEEELISTTTTSATVTPPTELVLSVDSKEKFYNNIIKKDSDINSFSENVKNIFDGPPTTPLPDQKHDSIVLPLSLDANNYHSSNNDDIKISNDKQPIPLQSSIEEMMSTATPALTPQAGSASSRRSSTTSFNTSSPAAKSRLQSALQKLSGPRQTTNPQQQTTESVVMNPSHSSTSISKSKSRFSSIRLTRRKSSGSVLIQPSQEEKHQHPELNVEVKPSTSSKLNNKLKKTTKRFSKLFAPST